MIKKFFPTITSSFAICLLALNLSAEDLNQYSMEELFESTEELTGEDKVLVLKEIIEKHKTNEQLFKQSISELVQHYKDTEQGEELLQLGYVDVLQYLEQRNDSKTFEYLKSETILALRKKPEFAQQLEDKYDSRGLSDPTQGAEPKLELVDMILQREDENLREEGLEKIAALLVESSTDEDKLKGLVTLHRCLTEKFYRPPFQQLVLPLIHSEDEKIATSALHCLPGLETPVSALPEIAKLADHENDYIRTVAGKTMIQIDQGQNPEVVIPVLVKLLNDDIPKVRRDLVRSMWGRYSSEEFDKLLVELSYEEDLYDVIVYHGLSPKPKKSRAVCKRLVEVLDDPDWNNSGRAAWGLTYGVIDEAYPFVENAVLKALPHETKSYTRKNLFRVLATVGTEKSKPYLEEVIESDLETEEDKERARAILETL